MTQVLHDKRGLATIDAWGRAILDIETLPEILYSGLKVDDVFIADSEETTRFNRLCRQWDRPHLALRTPEPMPHTPEAEHALRASQWLVCEELRDLDVRAFLLDICTTPEQVQRINEEMDLYEERNLIPLLRLMICLVDHFTQKGIVWGVGRGSSVASYVLYMIGVHRIDALRFGLSINEFLK